MSTNQDVESLYESLTKSGQKEILLELLRKRLEESGKIKQLKNDIENKMTQDNVSTQNLIQEIGSEIKDNIPEDVRNEIISKIKEHYYANLPNTE